ncbi:hypothetical protein MAH1_21210 [Sessilibacter sp. MAH1]
MTMIIRHLNHWKILALLCLAIAISSCGGKGPDNNPPSVDAGNNQTVIAGDTVQLNGSATDRDGEIAEVFWSENTDTITINNRTQRNASFIAPNVLEDTTFRFTLTATDDDGDSSTDSTRVVVQAVNISPTVDAGENQTVESRAMVNLFALAADSDGQISSYRWREVSGVIAIVNDDMAMASFVAPVVEQETNFTLLVTVQDDDGALASDSLLVTVNPPEIEPEPNEPPIANAGLDQSAQIGEFVTLDGQGSSDGDGDRLSFFWEIISAPQGSTATIQNPTALRPVVVIDEAGDYRVNLQVSDGQDMALDSVHISTLNTAPQANPSTDQQVFARETIQLNGAGSSDVDGNPLTFLWELESAPQGSNLDFTTSDQLRPILTTDANGEYIFRLIVNDGSVDSNPERILLTSGDLVPIAKAGPDIAVEINQTVQLEAGNASDPDAALITYHWHLLHAPQDSTAELTNAEAFNPQFIIDQPGDYLVQLIIEKQGQVSAPDQAVISTVNSRPVANAGSDLQVFEGEPITLDGTTSFDADGDTLDFFWSLIFLPTNSNAVLQNPASGSPIFTPDITGDFVAQLIVRDGQLSSPADTVLIEVVPPLANDPPSITSTPVIAAQIDQPYRYQVIAQDPENDPLSYSLLQGPLGLTLDQAGQVSWVPANDTQVDVRLSVSDGVNAPVIQTYQITVTGADAESPVLAPIGNQTAQLGQRFTMQLVASDPNGDILSFGVAPMPLPPNFSLNARTGLLSFRPEAGQVGVFNLSFSVTDGRFSDSEAVTITVPPADGTTRLSGQVLSDGNKPLPGVTLHVGESRVRSDVNGNFFFDDLSISGNTRLLIDGSTVDPALGRFATVPEVVRLVAGAVNQLDTPVFLLPLDIAATDSVDPTTTSTITSSRFIDGLSISEPVRLTIPAGSAVNDNTGELFNGDITITRVDNPNQGPQPLPEGLGLSTYISIQPFGVTYPEPVPISFPNVENFPPGSRMDFFALNHDTGEFEKVGEGLVSADGRTIDSIGGVVFSNSWHGVLPQEPVANPDMPRNEKEPSQNPKAPDNQEPLPPCCEKANCTNAGCMIDKQTGNLGEYHQLPSYYSLGENRSIRLEYNSNNADVRPIIPVVSGFGNQAPPPQTMSLELSVGGVAMTDKRFSQVQVVPDIRGQFRTSRPAIQFDGESLATGVHQFDLTVECQFPISFRSTVVPGEVIIDNRSNSEFGAGWSLAGLQKVYEQNDGKVLLTTGTKTSLLYMPDSEGGYISPPGDYTTLTQLPDGTFSRRMRSGIEYRFDSLGRQSRKIDRNGNVTTYIYDGLDRIETIIDPVGMEYNFAYANGRIQSITDPMNRVTRFEHDSQGNLVSIIEPNDDERIFEYMPNTHLMSVQVDQRGNRKEYRFDFAGRIQETMQPDGSFMNLEVADVRGLIPPEMAATEEDPAPAPMLVEDINNRQVDFNGNISVTESDARNMPLRYVDGVGRVTLTQRDANSNATQTTRPNQSVINRQFDVNGKATQVREEFNQAEYDYDYDQFSLLTEFVNPNDHATQFNRDDRGNVETIVNALGHTTTMEYDSRGLVTRMVTPNLLEVLYSYNSQGLLSLIEEIPPQGSPGNRRTTQYFYDEAGQTTRLITPDNITISINYDEKGRVTRVTDNLNQTINYGYDGYNNLIAVDTRSSDGSLALMVRNAYDNRNRMIESRAPHVNQEDSINQYFYDRNNNLDRWVDPNGAFESNEYDGEDRLIANTHRLGGITRYQYDTNDRITQVIAPNGVVTSFTYDVLGRKLTESSPDRGTLSYSYDQANNLITMTDGRGITMTYSYDELERPVSKSFPNTIAGKTEDVTYLYDNCPFGLGRLCGRIDESGSYSYAYDAFGNLVQMIKVELGISYTTSYNYDDGDNLIQMTYPTGRVVSIGRDGVRRIESVSAQVNGVQTSVVTDMRYRGDNRMIRSVYGNGLVDERGYDLQGRLISQQLFNPNLSLILDQRLYNYDANSNMLSRTTTPQTSVYTYDALDRLSGDAIDGAAPFEFDYDLNHNRLSRNQTDNNAQTNGETYTYRAGSNQLQSLSAFRDDLTTVQNVQTRTYNDANRLYQVLQDGELIAQYIYNDEGLRTRKTVFDQGGNDTTTIYHYDMYGMLISETSTTGVVEKDYIWATTEPIAQIDNQGGAEQLSFLHTDHLMTTRFATDPAQNIVWNWEGTAFGQTPANDNGITVNLRFPGQYFDAETGLHYNHYRDYDPRLGRYVQSDPIGLVAGTNTFGYVSGNPMMYYDPDGELAWFLVPIVGGFISGVIDLAAQLLENGGDWDCISWGNVAGTAAIGAVLSSTGPGGVLFGRSANAAGRFGSFPPRPGIFNRGNSRFGWSFNRNTQRQHFSAHGGRPNTPSHWHRDSPVSLPAGDFNGSFALGGGLAGGATGAASGEDCRCQN